MKKILKRIVACVTFLSLMVGMLYGVNWIFRLKATDGCYPMQMFYKQEENSIDVLCLGSSHTYTNINPAVLWDEYGMASYDLAGSNQPFWNSYYYLKEALKYQSPELIVLDVYRAIEDQDYIDTARVAMNMFGMRYSEDWKECLKESLLFEDMTMDYLLRYPVYHARYQELLRTDFEPYNGDSNGENYKGFNLNCISTTPFGAFPDITGVTEVAPLTDKTQEYLEKIIQLAKAEEIPLLLVNAPYIAIDEEEKAIFNRVEQIASAHGIKFVDFNEHFVEIGFDSTTDFAESSHLNYYGNVKYSRYLADYIHENYEVSDRRGDERYASWEANSDYYWKHAENVDIGKTKNVGYFFKKVFGAKERYTICVALSGNYKSDFLDVDELLGKYGMDTTETGVWVFKNGELIHTIPKEIMGESFYYEDLGEYSLTLLTEMRYSTMIEDYYPYRRICMEGVGVDQASDGVNIFVYDNELQEVVALTWMDATNENEATMY